VHAGVIRHRFVAVGLSVRAGMVRALRSWSCGAEGVVRAGGDDSHPPKPCNPGNPGYPCVRGWFGRRTGATTRGLGLPTRAGMIRKHKSTRSARLRIARVCGDDSIAYEVSGGLPTRAGMVRLWSASRRRFVWITHACGDGSSGELENRRCEQGSLCTRG
jgi:hypothetical protein